MNPEIKRVQVEIKEEIQVEKKSQRSKSGDKTRSAFIRPTIKSLKNAKEQTLGLRDLDLIEKI
jgi:hypothetical protein